MNIIEAAKAMKDGKRVRRPGMDWIDKFCEVNGEVGRSYVFWADDLIATDWEIAP